jgi:ATP-dependent RNA helicase DeaD
MNMTFATSGLKPEILSALDALGFETPTPIQQQTLSLIIDSDDDLIALAQTGTGKTAAFSLPLLQKLSGNERDIQILILAPTRELCLQITNDIKAFTKFMPTINTVAVYGGASITTQISALKSNVQIVVGTPGRTLDLIEKKKLRIENIKTLVLDEADEMLSMGFKDELDAILAGTPQDKQVLLFSATMPEEIRRIASQYMTKPREVSAGRENKSNENISHYYYQVSAKDRYNALKRIADINPNIYAIIFCRTKAETQEIADKLGHDGYNADALHGDLSQAQRDYVMNRFRKRQLQMLVATDVAARGLDVNDLTHVINYNLPDDPEVYIHRSGRTARAGKKGESVSIVHSKEMFKIKQLEKKIGKPIEHALVPTGKDICRTQLLNLIEKVKEVEIDEERINPFIPAILESIQDIDHVLLIKKFVSVEFNRFLNYYKDAIDINVHEKSRKERQDDNSKFVRFFMNHGSQSKITPGLLIELINEHIPSKNVEVGRIEIKKSISLFEVAAEDKELVISEFKKTNYKGLIVRPDVDPPSENKSSFEGGRSRGGYGDSRGSDRSSRSGSGYGRGRSDSRSDSRGGDSRGGERGGSRDQKYRGGDINSGFKSSKDKRKRF